MYISYMWYFRENMILLVIFAFAFKIILCSNANSKTTLSKSGINTNFLNRRIDALPIESVFAQSRVACFSHCSRTKPCQTYQFNNLTSNCVLLADIYEDITDVATTLEEGWNYYCSLKVDTHDTCFAFQDPSCQHLCLQSLVSCSTMTYATVQKICYERNGEIVKVESNETQLCLEEILDTIPSRFVYIQGTKGVVDGEWFFDNGNQMTYFNWDVSEGQPNNKADQKILTTKKSPGYQWHDLFDGDSRIRGAVCQINV